MESDVAEVRHAVKNSSSVKVHGSMCLELKKILERITSILPAIESARPGSKLGIQELCSLNNSVEKGRLLIQYCAEGSKLYLAITGEAILLRCERIRSSLNQSLYQIQNLVPLQLAAQVAEAIEYLTNAKFIIDSTEEEAGKAIRGLLRQTDSTEELEFETFRIAASMLDLLSPKAILVERRSVKKLLDKIHGTDPKKEGILNLLLYLLQKYGKDIKPDVGNHTKNLNAHSKCSTPNLCSATSIIKPEKNDEPADKGEEQIDMSGAVVPPEEFCCPISLSLMYDPVVIASGQTYERACIEKWFSEGHDSCPKTEKKLANFSLVPNTCMKDLISNWSREHGFEISEPCVESYSGAFRAWEPSHFHSISSLKNVSAPLLDAKAGDFLLQSDHSNVSFISSDTSYLSDSSHVRGIEYPKDNFSHLFPWSVDYQKHQSFSNFDHDMFLRFFCTLSELPPELQGEAIEDVKTLLEEDDETCYVVFSNGFVEALISFLKNSSNSSNVQELKTGAQLFLAFLNKNRVEIPSLREDVFQLLTSFLNSEIAMEALMILQKLSCYLDSKPKIVASGVSLSIIKFLDSEDAELLELAMNILCELSSQDDMRSLIISSGCIAKLGSILTDERLVECCLKILQNLSCDKEATVLMVETNGCLSSIVELLDTGSHDEQEHAVSILYSVCSHSFDNCLLVMKEGVIPALVDISVNGNDEGRETSNKLLRLLRDLRNSECFNDSCSQSEPISELAVDSRNHTVNEQPISKSSGFFSRKRRFFSKHRIIGSFLSSR
ncbi:U-box domain-containing protein 5-like isoform X1 [Typha angustifolia]|uniref:U-box domain-containing protein 5-like isoform X1 n=2 Tax=Typha angustifolia TaxID=59011 RepID=UPI003C2F55CA